MKIGFVSMPLSGHLNPMTALGRKLKSRGHEVTFMGVPDVGPVARAAGLDFIPFGEKEYPVGSITELYAPISSLYGLDVTRWAVREASVPLFKVASEQLPSKLKESGVEGLIIDTIYSFAELIPMRLGMPYVHVWNTLHADLSGATPPSFFSWPHETTKEALARNADGVKAILEIFGQAVPAAMSYAEESGLKIDWSDPAATISKLAVVTQTPRAFDFPGMPLPAQFHYAGPFHDGEGREVIPFPWEKLDGKPLVYVSMGTLVNGLKDVYGMVLQLAQGLPDVQFVLSRGSNIAADELATIPPNVIAVPKAPQIELLKRAALCITHAGLNTALECLAHGVPMVAIPIAFDQPGVAARIAHHGVGHFLELEELTAERLSKLLQRVLSDPTYHQRANYFKDVIASTKGLNVAAEVIEQAFQNNFENNLHNVPARVSRPHSSETGARPR